MKAIRCAIYTRKSSDERLDAEYSSLDNQQAYCSAYIASQGGNGWEELAARYDDGGYSGGSLRRPALTQLRADIEQGLIDMVVVYKIDRLSRSLRDFANLINEFEGRKVSFTSVTQAFDTSTSMGRLTLNVLLSFAQFEREMTGERLRDWFAGARKKGMWVPKRPFGYIKQDGNRLVPDPAEAEVVRRIYRRYCKLGSCARVAQELFEHGIMGTSGRPWSASMVLHTIKHRVYRGEIVHKKKSLPGTHEPIVSDALWQRAHKTYLNSKWTKRALIEAPVPPILTGLIFDRLGLRLHHTFARAKGRLYRYYIAGAECRRYGTDSDPYMRFRADALEQSVIDIVDRMTGSRWETRPRNATIEMLRKNLERIDLDAEGMRLTFRTGAQVQAVAAGRLGPRRRHNIAAPSAKVKKEETP